MLETIQSLDWSILNFIKDSLSCGFLDVVMPLITRLGSKGAIWILTGVFLLLSKKYRKYGIILLLGLLAGALIGNVCLKNLIQRPRPCWIDPDVKLLTSIPTDYSFPSGHTLSSAIAAVILTLTDRRFAFAAIPLACLIAFSRLYLYVHFPSDILAGIVLGIAIGFGVYKAAEKIILKQHTPQGKEKKSI